MRFQMQRVHRIDEQAFHDLSGFSHIFDSFEHRHDIEQTFGFAVSAMANKAVLAGVEYLSAYAAAIGEDA